MLQPYTSAVVQPNCNVDSASHPFYFSRTSAERRPNFSNRYIRQPCLKTDTSKLMGSLICFFNLLFCSLFLFSVDDTRISLDDCYSTTPRETRTYVGWQPSLAAVAAGETEATHFLAGSHVGRLGLVRDRNWWTPTR